jgi:hypothetical protein
VVSSFAANVDPAGTLRRERTVEVTALINCDEGDHAIVTLTLQLGAATGRGRAEARCDGTLLPVPMIIHAQGPNGFQPGEATASLEATVRGAGGVIEETQWTRQVVLSLPN